LLVDAVGRFESLEEDFSQICRRLGLSANLPHANRSSHRDYRFYYTDRTIEYVADRCRDDISRFGYAFDDAADQTRLGQTQTRIAA